MLKIVALALLISFGLTAKTWETEVRVGYFVPSSTIVRKMFPTGWVDYAIEGSYLLEGRWTTWANVGFGYKKGHSVPLHQPTKLYIVPLSLGLAGYFDFPYSIPLSLRLGLGASWSFVNTHNTSDVVKKQVNKNNAGCVVKTNLQYVFWRNCYLNLFADYSYTLFKARGANCVKRYDLNLSGLHAGLGLGIDY